MSDEDVKVAALFALLGLLGGVAGCKLASKHKIIGTLVGMGIGAAAATLVATKLLAQGSGYQRLSSSERRLLIESLLDET